MKISMHSVERTSPKGEKFVGICRLCGKEGLTTSDIALEECPNPKGLSFSEILKDAIRG